MDAAASQKVDADIDDVYAFFLKIENTNFPTAFKQRSTVIKYTKLPEFDFESHGSWPQNSYTLHPRLRRIVTLEEPETNTSRSLKTIDPLVQHRTMATSLNKRKIVTISENDEYDLHPKFSKDSRKSNSLTSNRSNGTGLEKQAREISNRTMSRLTTSAKYSKESKPSAKTNIKTDKKESTSKSKYKNRTSNTNQPSMENIKSRSAMEKDTLRNTKSVALSRTSLSKNFVRPSGSEKEISVIKSKLYENLKSTTSSKKSIDKPRTRRRTPSPENSKASFLIEMQNKNKHLPVIYVPLEEKNKRDVIDEAEISSSSAKPTIIVYTKSDGSMDNKMIVHKNANTATEPLPRKENRLTDMEGFGPDITHRCVERDVQTDVIEQIFDKLKIPDVSLKKNKIEQNEELLDLHSKSLPNLQIPAINITDNRNEKSFVDAHFCKSTSYIISRSTLTYRTKQKINFHVVGSNDKAYSNQSPSPLIYPLNVVSVFKEEMSSKDVSNNISLEETHESKSSKEFKNCINEVKSLDCSFLPNSDKLMKPSDIISTIRVNDSLFQSVCMCEQFQRELNFIDSFFESLQYLESCSLSEQSLRNDKYQELANNPALLGSELAVKNSEYDNFLSKLENGTNSDDTETMASKNIFLLNILIRDEQRRAKNLLYVLKRREDALKDFTKSQILYLENKKKQDNTDISALKKKQRGALLKLQHECGEMQRMRKALLTLSEKRKVALMKTKKDLELKLKNNVAVEQIILGKKKPKRNTGIDRGSVPLKCFDLSSSGCEDSITSRHSTESITSRPGEPATREKSIQTGDSIPETTLVSRSTDTAAENFVVVDGSYLNILFQNLSLPQMFSGGKQYEVNEEAIRNIVNSTTSLHDDNWCEVVDKLMDQVTSDEVDKSSSPSTARSLVEEFEQYYRTLAEADRLHEEEEYKNSRKMYDNSDVTVQTSLDKVQVCEIQSEPSTCTIVPESSVAVEASVILPLVSELSDSELLDPEEVNNPPVICPAGPLPVPPGAADVSDVTVPGSLSISSKSSNNSFTESSTTSSQSGCDLTSSVSSLAAPAHVEAEELRRQQLAIEREIKELEQQQCRLLVVREIPDKPPPPYTPPADTRAPKLPRLFQSSEVIDDRIQKYVIDPNALPCDPTDAFDVLVHDFCEDTLNRHRLEQGDKPCDAYNLLPQKPLLDDEKLVLTASSELAEVLTAATPTIVSGVSSRRSDHIDDILFSEWRRVEPEWTSLHSDEAIVKNQLFETIFQRILTETVDEYKRTVLSPVPDESVL